MYRKLYSLDHSSIMDNRKFSGMSYFPRSLEEKLGIYKKEDNKDEKKDEKKVEKKEEKKMKVETIPSPEPIKKVEKKEEKKEEKKPELESGVCSVDTDGVKHICGSGAGNLYPIMDPRFNLREACKNMILLEDHLFHTGKRCHDCILKHAMTIEGFLEEGITLDKTGEYKKILGDSFKDFRTIFEKLVKYMKTNTLGDKECDELAQSIRKIRKPLCQQFATFLS